MGFGGDDEMLSERRMPLGWMSVQDGSLTGWNSSPMSMSASGSWSWDGYSRLAERKESCWQSKVTSVLEGMEDGEKEGDAEKLAAKVLTTIGDGPEGRKALQEDMISLVNSKKTFLDVMKTFMSVFCEKRGWNCAELWTSADSYSNKKDAVLEMKHGVVVDQGDEGLQRFHQTSSRIFVIGEECLPGRVWRKAKPEWLRCATDERLSSRANLSFRCGVKIGFAVPVFLQHEVCAVLCFFDRSTHSFEGTSIELASRCSAALAAAWQYATQVNDI